MTVSESLIRSKNSKIKQSSYELNQKSNKSKDEGIFESILSAVNHVNGSSEHSP